MINVRILGVSGTVIKDGNCDKLVQEALRAAAELEDVETEFVALADKDIASCQHCQYCIENRRPCQFKDDMQPIYEMMEKADGMLLASPTWGYTIAPPLINLLSRGRFYSFMTDTFRNKPVGALTLGWFGFGLDHALSTILNYVSARSMIPVARASALSSTAAYGQRAAYMENGVLDDKAGMARVRSAALRVVEVTRMIKYAKEAGVVTPEAGTVTGGR
ncbi:flavodoxin family protein, partial [Thermodesulfobacteriota bacterium]